MTARSMPEQEWFGIFAFAGKQLNQSVAEAPEVKLVSRATGLPESRVLRALVALASDLSRMEEILSCQSPDQTVTAYRTGGTFRWSWIPRGRHVAVRIPANFPTINITWLLALAMRRPVLLCTSHRDPFTAPLLARCLYESGLPDGAISLCHESAEGLWALADQLLWPGDTPGDFVQSDRVKRYHHGRSKAVVLEDQADPHVWLRLARLAAQGCGRLCTNVSGVLVEQNAGSAARALAEALLTQSVRSLADPDATIPATPDQTTVRQIVSMIRAAVQRGAIDVSAEVTGLPLGIVHDGLTFLRPTVLLTDPSDPLWSAELPFPFVTVAEVPRDRLICACRNSLIVSLATSNRSIVDEFIAEPSIDKVFFGEDLERGYDPTDPHEGFLADFLFKKKAVSPHP
jgi:thienamycin biosynthesis protein ThnO